MGYSFRAENVDPRRESLSKMEQRIKELTTRKRSGSTESIAKQLNHVLIGSRAPIGAQNANFTAAGLWSLREAHNRFLQSHLEND